MPDEPVLQTTEGESVTNMHRYTAEGEDLELTERNPITGASSEAPAGSGVPSADKQRGLKVQATEPQDETPLAGRTQPATQNTQ